MEAATMRPVRGSNEGPAQTLSATACREASRFRLMIRQNAGKVIPRGPKPGEGSHKSPKVEHTVHVQQIDRVQCSERTLRRQTLVAQVLVGKDMERYPNMQTFRLSFI